MAYARINNNTPQQQNRLVGVKFQRGFIFGAIMLAALFAFELFNFGTTEYALADLLGATDVVGVGWASVLAVAFCAIDFAGLARLFTPEKGADEPKEVWYLMGAWFLGACANAIMTWWAITLALLPRPLGNEVLSRAQLLTFVPVFVAALVWLTRILIIGTFAIAGERVFTLAAQSKTGTGSRAAQNRPRQIRAPATSAPASRSSARPAHQPNRAAPKARSFDEDELVYEPIHAQPTNVRPPYGKTRPAPKPAAAPAASYGYGTAGRPIPKAQPSAWRAPGFYNNNGGQSFTTGVDDWLQRRREDGGMKFE